METKDVIKSKTEWPSLFEKNRWIDRFFDFPFPGNFNFGAVLNVPSINVKETDKHYKLSVAAPGLEKADFNIQISKGMLTISAEKEQSKDMDSKYNKREYNYSSWSRSFTLPEDAVDDEITAEYNNGELTLNIPRNDKRKRQAGTRIDVK